jgi:GNAT superfamily N-acetyltransferase
MEIRLIGPNDHDSVVGASALFDGPANPYFAQRFLDSDEHFLFVAYEGEHPVGFVSGEMTHPDKGTERFLYELSVAESFRGRGTATALVTALRDLARQRGGYDMWVLTDTDNAAGLATYQSTGANVPTSHVMLSWDFDPPDSHGATAPLGVGQRPVNPGSRRSLNAAIPSTRSREVAASDW